MATAASEHTPMHVQQILHERFVKQQDYHIWDVSVSMSGNIAVSGYNKQHGRTFIDIYKKNSDSKDSFQLFYSKDFEQYSHYKYRYVSFLGGDGTTIVTLFGDKLEIFDAKNDKVLRSCKINDRGQCLASCDGQIFTAFADYPKLYVLHFDLDHNDLQNLNLKAIPDFCWPWDLQVIKNIAFVCDWHGRASCIEMEIGDLHTFTTALVEYRDYTGRYKESYGIAVSDRLSPSIIAVLWGDSWWGGDRIIFYSVSGKPFLVIDLDAEVLRIRISDEDGKMITGNRKNGEIKIYDIEQFFSFEAMKRTLTLLVTEQECEELRKYFQITEEEIKKEDTDEIGNPEKRLNEEMSRLKLKNDGGLIKTDQEVNDTDAKDDEETIKKMECLLTVIEGKGYLDCHNIKKMKDAISVLSDKARLSKLMGPIEGYERFGRELKSRENTSEDDKSVPNKEKAGSSDVKEQKETDEGSSASWIDKWYTEWLAENKWRKRVNDAEQRLERDKEANSQQPTENQNS